MVTPLAPLPETLLTAATIPTLVLPRLDPANDLDEPGFHILDDLKVIISPSPLNTLI
jgi:hypothetical protein